jgi:hypothetical protein
MPGRDILGNDVLVTPAAFDTRRRVIFLYFTRVAIAASSKKMQDQSYLVFNGPPSKCPFKG